MTPTTPAAAEKTGPAPSAPASTALSRGELGARIVRLAQVAAAVHAARAPQAKGGHA